MQGPRAGAGRTLGAPTLELGGQVRTQLYLSLSQSLNRANIVLLGAVTYTRPIQCWIPGWAQQGLHRQGLRWSSCDHSSLFLL